MGSNMSDFCLHKFKFISFDIPASVYLQVHRLVNEFSNSEQLDRLWQQLHFCRALKFKRDIYAFDNYVLLSVLAERYPNHSITVQIIPVNGETALHQQILANILINSVCQFKARSAPAFERAACRTRDTERLFGTSKWAQILDVHRSTLYTKERPSVSEDIAVIDTASVLKAIPLPTPEGQS